MNPLDRPNVHKLLQHPFITGDSSLLNDNKRLTDRKNFKSESLHKNIVDNNNINSINGQNRRMSENALEKEELHFSSFNQSIDRKYIEKFESNNKKKNDLNKKVSKNDISKNITAKKKSSINVQPHPDKINLWDTI